MIEKLGVLMGSAVSSVRGRAATETLSYTLLHQLQASLQLQLKLL